MVKPVLYVVHLLRLLFTTPSVSICLDNDGGDRQTDRQMTDRLTDWQSHASGWIS